MEVGEFLCQLEVRPLFNTKFGELICRSGQHGLAASRHDRPLDELSMFRHYANQLLGAQILFGHILVISGLIFSKRLLRLQSGTLQQTLQFAWGEGLLGVVNALKLNSFFSQDPLDLTALGSCRLLVDRNRAGALHCCLLIRRSRQNCQRLRFLPAACPDSGGSP